MEFSESNCASNPDLENIIKNEIVKCGEIFFSECGNFSVDCLFCSIRFKGVQFFEHFMNEHHLNDRTDKSEGEDQNQIELSLLDSEGADLNDINLDFFNDDAIRFENTDVEDYFSFEDLSQRTEDFQLESTDSECESLENNFETAEIRNVPKFYQCNVCDLKFDLKRVLLDHKRNICKFKCDVCARIFEKKSSLRTHVYRHHNPEKVKQSGMCILCGKNSKNLEDHLKRHKANDEWFISGEDNAYQSNGEGVTRGAEAHESYSNLHPCNVCNIQFNSRKVLMRHKMLICGYKCDICLKIFKKEAAFEEHQIKSHNRPKSQSIAGVCEKCGNYYKNLKIHLLTHETVRKTYPCSACSKVFLKQSYRKIHFMLKHVDDKPFACQFENCRRRFAGQKLLELHQKCHEQKKFECSICKKQYTYKSKLVAHFKLYHIQGKMHRCLKCDKGFYDPWNLKKHMRIHVKKKPFECDECEAKFATDVGLRWHKKVHTGSKECVCTICNQRFNIYSTLYAHRKKCKGAKSES